MINKKRKTNLLLAIFFNIIILNQKIFTYEKISIIVLSIYGLFLCYGVLYEDKEIVKEVHDLFFYFNRIILAFI